MSSRDQVLGSIRKALGRAPGPPLEVPPAPVLRIPTGHRCERGRIFAQALEKLAGHVIFVADTASVLQAIEQLLQGRRVVASNSAYLTECGIQPSGFTDHAALKQACAAADVGITSAAYALAETGSLVMLSNEEEARLISLLPPVHIAVIPAERILANLDELLTVLPKPAEQTSAMVFITGPSRTADIEQILVRGVHGPGEVHVVIVG